MIKPFKLKSLNQNDAYPFQYKRSVQPEVNKNRHIVQTINKQLSKKDKKHTPSHELLYTLDKGYAIGDPLCDEWVAYALKHKLPAHGMLLFKEALENSECVLSSDKIQGKKIPKPLKALFQQAMTKPSWHDDDKILLACQSLARYPFQQGLVLQSMSLMGGYCVPALAEPLLATGQLSNNVVARIARTLCFLASVTIPQGLERNPVKKQWEMGFKQTLNTRVIHALVRYKLQHNFYSNPWQQHKFGIPINQTDMIATNMSFSLTVIHGLTALDCNLSNTEKIALLHLWRYVAHIIGIDDKLIPKNEDEANKWLHAYLTTQEFDPKPASKLAKPLHELPILIETADFKGMAKIEQNLRAGITRSYWGDDICDGLGLPKPKVIGAGIFGMSKMQLIIEQLQKSSPLTQQIMMKSAEHFRTSIKEKYLAAAPEVEPLFDEILELAMRSHWQ